MVRKILAIDPGSNNMGLYDGEAGATLVANRGEPRAQRLAALMDQLTKFFAQNGPYDFVVYEEQFVRGGPATKALYGVVGIIEAVSAYAGAGVMPLPQGTLRKWAAQQMKELKGKELYEKLAVARDPRLLQLPGVTEHVFDAACVYHFISDNGEFN